MKIRFKKEKVLVGIFFSLLMLLFSISFLIKSEIYTRNFYMDKYIRFIGIIGILYFSGLFYSILKLFSQKYAILITNEYLIDNSRYESIGKIEWKNISKIQRIKRKSIELVVNKNVLKNRKVNPLEKFLLFMHNWNYKDSIIISCNLIDCDIEDLYHKINFMYQKS